MVAGVNGGGFGQVVVPIGDITANGWYYPEQKQHNMPGSSYTPAPLPANHPHARAQAHFAEQAARRNDAARAAGQIWDFVQNRYRDPLPGEKEARDQQWADTVAWSQAKTPEERLLLEMKYWPANDPRWGSYKKP
jgi:hypothetical protein